MLNRPKVFCHLLTSIDGKIIDSNLETKEINYAKEWYDEITCEHFSSFLCDKEKMEELFTKKTIPNLESFKNKDIDYKDYITYECGNFFAIAIDPY